MHLVVSPHSPVRHFLVINSSVGAKKVVQGLHAIKVWCTTGDQGCVEIFVIYVIGVS